MAGHRGPSTSIRYRNLPLVMRLRRKTPIGVDVLTQDALREQPEITQLAFARALEFRCGAAALAPSHLDTAGEGVIESKGEGGARIAGSCPSERLS